MMKKVTRKIRNNKRTTQWRKNRSYKRMRGGVMFEKKKIVRLLSNLIINLIIINRKDIISKLCNPQSSPSQSAEQPLLSKQGLFVNAERVKEELIDMYRKIQLFTTKGPLKQNRKYEYIFSKDDEIKKFIIKQLQSKDIKYFDHWVETDIPVELLEPDAFGQSLTKKWFTFMPDDKLVNSFFYLAYLQIYLKWALNENPDEYKSMINLVDEPECPHQFADI